MVSQNNDGNPSQDGDLQNQGQNGANQSDRASQSASQSGDGGSSGDQGSEPRTYTQAEHDEGVRAAQSLGDKRADAANKIAGQALLNVRAERAATIETAAKNQDAQYVADGDLTQAQADGRGRERARIVQETNARQREIVQMDANKSTLEGLAREIAGTQLAEQYGVDKKALMEHPDTQIGVDDGRNMEFIAKNLQFDKKQANIAAANHVDEEFDGSGNSGSGGALGLGGKTPQQLAVLAYSDSETAKRNKARGR